MRRKYLALLSGLLVVLVLSGIFIAAYGETDSDKRPRIEVGDLLELKSLRGLAVEFEREENGQREVLKAEVALKVEVVEIKGSRLSFKVLDGYIKIGEDMYSVEEGRGHAVLGKFGWLGVGGNASNEGSEYRFYLEGMLHIESPGLVVAGLTGVFRDDGESYRLRIIAKIAKSE